MYVRIAIIGLAVASSGWMGYRLAEGRCAAAMYAAESANRIAQDRAIAQASAELEAQSERAVRAAEARGRASAAAQEVINEIHTAPDSRACEWTDDQRLRIERIYDLYRERPSPATSRVQDTLSASTLD